MIKNLEEERGGIQSSYAQIIKSLSHEIDEIKRKKGIPTTVQVNKSIQTEQLGVSTKAPEPEINETEEIEETEQNEKTTVDQRAPAAGGFFSGISSFLRDI